MTTSGMPWDSADPMLALASLQGIGEVLEWLALHTADTPHKQQVMEEHARAEALWNCLNRTC